MTQEQLIEEALACTDSSALHKILAQLDFEALHEYNLRALARSTVAGGPSPAIRDRTPVRQER